LSQSTLLLKLSLLSDPKLLCAVRAAVGEVTVMFGFRDAEVRSIVLAVDEALANVMTAPYRFPSTGIVSKLAKACMML
jgi:anti-sigma regulatory factor (Ser/Thr protein kinase)